MSDDECPGPKSCQDEHPPAAAIVLLDWMRERMPADATVDHRPYLSPRRIVPGPYGRARDVPTWSLRVITCADTSYLEWHDDRWLWVRFDLSGETPMWVVALESPREDRDRAARIVTGERRR